MDTPLHNNIRSLQEKLEGLYEWLNAPELSIDEYKQVVAQVQILTRTLTQTALALEDRAAEKNHTASDIIVESLPPHGLHASTTPIAQDASNPKP